MIAFGGVDACQRILPGEPSYLALLFFFFRSHRAGPLTREGPACYEDEGCFPILGLTELELLVREAVGAEGVNARRELVDGARLRRDARIGRLRAHYGAVART